MKSNIVLKGKGLNIIIFHKWEKWVKCFQMLKIHSIKKIVKVKKG